MWSIAQQPIGARCQLDIWRLKLSRVGAFGGAVRKMRTLFSLARY